MHSTFDFPGGGGVQDGGRDLQRHQHPRHSGGAVDQARADSVEETPCQPYRFPRVFGDEFGDEFGDSLNFVSKLVTHLVMISVNHCIW